MAQISSKKMVSAQSPKLMQNSPLSPPKIAVGVLVFLVLLVVWVSSADKDQLPLINSDAAELSSHTSKGLFPPNEVVKGSLGSIPYYYCGPGPTVDPSNVKNVVLLHGARFTKEDWKTSGILGMLCEYNQISVTAFDLPVQSDYEVLVPLLQNLAPAANRAKIMATKIPISALVTPSASGQSVVSAIQQGKVADIRSVVELWVPIASGIVQSLEASQLQKVKNQNLQILAMNGDQDPMGRKVGKKLALEAGAEVMEFPGGHPFYLSVPREFTNALVAKLGVLN